MTERDQDAEFRELLERAAQLPKSIEPPRDLWPEIEARIAGKARVRFRAWLLIPLAAAAALAVLLLGRRGPPRPGEAWEVTRVAGVPLGFRAETRRGFGPGTPYAEDASQALRRALAAFDFAHGGGGAEAVRQALAAARPEDAVSLWHLLRRVDRVLRGEVYDRLASLVPPPAGVTRQGALQLDRAPLETYWNTIRRIAWRRSILKGIRDIDPRTGMAR